VKAFNVIKYIGSGYVHGAVFFPANSLTFEHAEKSFTSRVVTAMTNRTHGTGQIIFLQILLVIAAAKLSAAIRMQDHRTNSLPRPNCHFNRTNDHLPILPMMHRPADYQLAEQIQNDTQKQFSLKGFYLGDIGHPFGFWL